MKSLFSKKAPADVQPAPDSSDSPAPEQSARVEVEAAASPAPAAVEVATRKGLGFLNKSSVAAPNKSADPVVAASAPAAITDSAPAKPKLAGLTLGKVAPPTPPVAGPAQDDPLSDGALDLASLMDDESAPPVAAPARKRFDDEIPATAPTRPIPDEATPAMLKFVSLIDSVYDMQFDVDLLGNVIKAIMIELQTNPIYISKDWKRSLVQPDDIRIWIRNMREVMGLNKIVKQEAKAKRGSSKKKTVDSNEMLDDLASLGFSIGV